MDPLSAAGLAASCLQFLQFGVSLVSKTRQIHTSVLVSLPDNIDCEKVTTRLVELAEGLKYSLSNDLSAQSASLNIPNTIKEPGAETLKKVCNDCIEVSTILLERLEKLKRDEKEERRKWKSFRQALKSVWSKKDLDAISSRLLGFKQDLELHLCVEIRKDVAALKPRLQRIDGDLGKIFTTMEESKKWTIQTLLEERGFLKSTLADTGDLMLKAAAQQWARIQETIITAIGEEDALNIDQSLLQSLAFPMMHHRKEAIPEAHKATFQWIFHDKPQSSNCFVTWLESGSSVFWINGKAASGKSTLMKFLLEDDDSRLLQHLKKWSGADTLHVPSFYFWLGGSRQQRTLEGLFRSLLYESFQKFPEFVREIFPYEWAENCSLAAQKKMPDWKWNLKRLQSAFARLCSFPTTSLKICFFIDGLDEYQGDHEELAEFFKSLSFERHIKVCISSRPLIVFEDAFQKCPGLRLQDLTFPDIMGYVQVELGNHARMLILSKKSPKSANELVSEIVTKANGVFLWVTLVVRSLLKGLTNRDDISVLKRRLSELPSDLEALYKVMLRSVDSVYQDEASQIFQIYHAMWLVRESSDFSKLFQNLTATNGAIPALELELAVNSSRQQAEIEVSEVMNEAEVAERSLRMDEIVKTRCAGLLETNIVTPSQYAADTDEFSVCRIRPLVYVSYLHRTVRDFLVSEDVLAFQRSLSKKSFNPHYSLLICCISMLKRSLCPKIYSSRPYESIIATSELGFLYAELCEGADSSDYIDVVDLFSRAIEEALVQHGENFSGWARNYTRYDYHEFSVVHSSSSRWPSMIDLALLITAIRRRLYSYLDHKLSLKGTQLSSHQESSLLLYSQSKFNYDSEFPDITITQMLLKHGADPNLLRNGHTAWQYFLRSAHDYSRPTCPIRKPDLAPLLAWVRLFKLLLQNGASPHTTCVQRHETWIAVDCDGNFGLRLTGRHKVEDVIKEVFGCLLPNEAAELLRIVELQKSLQNQDNYIPGEKRRCDAEQEQRIVRMRMK